MIQKLNDQINFLVEVDKMKQIFRNTILMDKSRKENDAEHSWHMALAAMTLREYSNDQDIDMLRVIKMVIIHDIVEIDAGDVFAYGNINHNEKAIKEEKAAQRIFGLLPEVRYKEFMELWREFEEGASSEAKFAQALDCFMPVLHNYRTQGLQWQKLNVTSGMVLKRNKKIEHGSKILWEYIESIVSDAVKKNYLMK